MKKFRKRLKYLLFVLILIVGAILILDSKGFLNTDEMVNKINNIITSNGDKEEEKVVIEIIDDNIYINDEELVDLKNMISSLKDITSSKEVHLKSKKAKIVTYNNVVKVLKENNYIVINED